MKKIAICGVYGEGKDFSGGQPVKVRLYYSQLLKNYGEQNILLINTYRWKKNPLKLFSGILKSLVFCKNILIFPAHNGVKIMLPIYVFFNIFFKKRIHYLVIGGWLPNLLIKNKWLLRILERVDYIYPETEKMCKRLLKLGLDNCRYLPNIKIIEPLKNLVYNKEDYIKICFFSRVTPNKGIEDAVDAINFVNRKANKTIFKLDIYGIVQEEELEWFNKLNKKFGFNILYKGVANPDESVEIIKNYDFQIFPTRFFTEGIPGSILDSFCAGVPVISSRWENFEEILNEGLNAIGYKFLDKNDLVKKLEMIYEGKYNLRFLKENCLEKSKEFYYKNVLNKFLKFL